MKMACKALIGESHQPNYNLFRFSYMTPAISQPAILGLPWIWPLNGVTRAYLSLIILNRAEDSDI